MNIRIDNIIIPDRIRRDQGDLSLLADSISRYGLLNPITLMESEKGFVLIAGYRRLEACRMIGLEVIPATILSPMDAGEQLMLEITENEDRKDFTIAEKIAYAEKLKVIEAEKARIRMSKAARLMAPPSDARKTRDAVAQVVGFKSGRQLDRALYVAHNRPDLMYQVECGTKSVTKAYEEARGISRKRRIQENVPIFINSQSANLGYGFVLHEVVTAIGYFTEAIENAAKHYRQIKQTDAQNETIFQILDEAAHKAQCMFGEAIEGDIR